MNLVTVRTFHNINNNVALWAWILILLLLCRPEYCKMMTDDITFEKVVCSGWRQRKRPFVSGLLLQYLYLHLLAFTKNYIICVSFRLVLHTKLCVTLIRTKPVQFAANFVFKFAAKLEASASAKFVGEIVGEFVNKIDGKL